MPHVEYKDWPSVTQILSLPEKSWKWNWYRSSVKKNGWRGWQRNDAQGTRGKNIGTDYHALLHTSLVIQTGVGVAELWKFQSKLSLHPLIDSLVDVTLKWISEIKPRFIRLEEHFISDRYRYHGTCDAIVELANEYEVWDWKSNNQEDIYHKVQLSAYANAINLSGILPKPVTRGRVIQVNKKLKTPKVLDRANVPFTNLDQYFPLFLGLKENWEFINGKGKWGHE